MRADRILLGAGSVASAVVLLAALRWPEEALAGWLAGAVAATSVPAGALLLLMMMRLVPGAWGEVLRLSCEAAVLTAPLAFLAFVPLFFGLGWLYPWLGRTAQSAFAAGWLSVPGYVLRTLIWFVYLAGFSWAMLSRRNTGFAAASGLVLMPILAHLVAVDWLMSRDPQFASSAFGLQLLSIMTTIAFCATLLLRRAMRGREIRTGVIGALLLTLLLIWAYLNFMAYLIVWSGNLPNSVGWYAARSGIWANAMLVAAILGGVPLLMLLFGRVRRSPRALGVLAATVLVGKLIELLWFAIPPNGGASGLFGILAVGGVGCLYAALLPRALEWRIGRRAA